MDDSRFDDYKALARDADRTHLNVHAVVIIAILLFFVLGVLFLIRPYAAQPASKETAVVQEPPREPQAQPSPVTEPPRLPKLSDDERRELNELRSDKANLLVRQRELESKIGELEQSVAEKEATITSKDSIVKAWESDYAYLSGQYNLVAGLNNNSEQYASELAWEQSVHLSIGCFASMPIARPEDGSATVFLGVGPSNWKVIAGVGYSIGGDVTVSAGFEYRFGRFKRDTVPLAEAAQPAPTPAQTE